mgnify:CR=1 FL=1
MKTAWKNYFVVWTLETLVAKYFWPGLEKDVKPVVEECAACQTHGSSQKSESLRLALDYVNRPMQSRA